MTSHRYRRLLGVILLLGAILVLGTLIRSCGKPEASAEKGASLRSKRIREEPGAIHPLPVAASSISKNEVAWVGGGSREPRRVRSALKMEAVPACIETAYESTVTVSIRVAESADIWRSETQTWEEMTEEEFRQWRKGLRDHHSATATMVRVLDHSGSVSVERKEFVGDGQKIPGQIYMETEAGINITLDWEGQDALNVRWRGYGAETGVEKVMLPFSKRFQNAREQTEPPAGDVPEN